MNNGQGRFFHFIMERVTPENKEKAKELLNESFTKQDEGTFNQEYMMRFIPQMLGLLKPECIEEVKNIMAKHRG
ncbi:hypothetical protein [uncultured Clostridium sp.]|uniref:hypothetical protein n=1 Tax=uncultured Clostridium sp. TaxID=59620 RepID=UPI002635CC4B|nr:hypothetical protein [uncultured Clostridium sp.]